MGYAKMTKNIFTPSEFKNLKTEEYYKKAVQKTQKAEKTADAVIESGEAIKQEENVLDYRQLKKEFQNKNSKNVVREIKEKESSRAAFFDSIHENYSADNRFAELAKSRVTTKTSFDNELDRVKELQKEGIGTNVTPLSHLNKVKKM